MQRRHFIKLTGLSALVLSQPFPNAAFAASTSSNARTLVLIELKGGNDGLNTIVPYADPDYYRLRPAIAIARDQVVPLSPKMGMHPALQPLVAPWQAKEMAVVLGVGYPNPNRSHFRSIDIWETGSDADESLQQGWLARLFAAHQRPTERIDGIVLGQDDLGPLDSERLRTAVMTNPKQFLKQARRLQALAGHTGNPSLDHILTVQNSLLSTSSVLAQELERAPQPSVSFPGHRLGQDLKLAAQLILSKTPVTVLKLSHGSFDTHARQPNVHQRLLRQLGDGLAAFREALIKGGRWNDTLVMTYSEFGRRVKENASRGTDHGTAAPHLLMGGRVKGGLYGKQPSLTATSQGDLIHHVDFRQLYTTLGQRWWGLDPSPVASPTQFRPLDLV